MSNHFKDAAQILRGLKERVDRLEERREQAGLVNIFRSVTDSGEGRDTISVVVDDNPGWVWDSSRWDFDEWRHPDIDPTGEGWGQEGWGTMAWDTSESGVIEDPGGPTVSAVVITGDETATATDAGSTTTLTATPQTADDGAGWSESEWDTSGWGN